MTVYAFGLEEHLYSGSGVHQSDTYYYMLGSMLVGESTGSGTNMFLTDALGSVIETISATANTTTVQGNQVYSPYGSSRYQQGSMGTTKGFTGQYNDAVTGLDYYNARYYDPVVGRFLSIDKVSGNMQGADPYAYVGGNPETKNDPTGQRNSIVSPERGMHHSCRILHRGPNAFKVEFDEPSVRERSCHILNIVVGLIIQEYDCLFCLQAPEFCQQILETMLEYPAIGWQVDDTAGLHIG